ncbi:uncharacterized protein ATC70_008525 [Mucor velutinosus]|uniref:F-box domain-containing protein n=1 Tax=Mucor velutinosus TaxID=708070 RepID=A0AAN7DS31_9FUNG|nr:hypothetical protein ATC70_008525 [Mucor velutinosus]
MIRNLPDELIAKIIDYNVSTADVAVCRLVCKRWSHLAEPLMFGKQITIRSEADALSLYGHLCRNPRYGKLVKRIHFQESDIMYALLEGLLHFILTPNMEKMTGRLSSGHSFFRTACKIAKASTAKFDRLQVLPYPLYSSNAYDDALIAFKDTLREMVLVLDANQIQAGVGIDSFIMDFKSLVHLTLNGSLGSLFLMEEFLQHCSTLEELTIHLHLADNVHEKTFVETWAVPIVKAMNSVKKVTFKQECRSDQLEYIRIKYPKINTLIIDVHTTPLIVGRNNIKRIVKAMKGVPTYNIKLLIKEGNLEDMIGHLLDEGYQFNVKEADFDQFKIEMESPSQ